MSSCGEYGQRRQNLIWWLAELVLLHQRAPSAAEIQCRWNVSRMTAWRYHYMAQDRLDMRNARQGRHP